MLRASGNPEVEQASEAQPSEEVPPPRTNPVSSREMTGLFAVGQWARRDSNARPLAPEASALSN